MTAGLNQTVRELQQLLQAISWQLTKGKEGVRPVPVTTEPSFHWKNYILMWNLNICHFLQEADEDLPKV